MADTTRPADPLTEEEMRDAIYDAANSEEAGSYPRFLDALATYVAARAPRSDPAGLCALTCGHEGLHDMTARSGDDALRAALLALVRASEGVQWKIGGENKGPGEAYLDAVINARNLLATPAAPPTDPRPDDDEWTLVPAPPTEKSEK